jgi:hypothetical protein
MSDLNPDAERRGINNRRINEAVTCPECEGALGFDVDKCPACGAHIVWIQMKVALFSTSQAKDVVELSEFAKHVAAEEAAGTAAERDAAVAHAVQNGSSKEFAKAAVEAGYEFTGEGGCAKCQLIENYRTDGDDRSIACGIMRQELRIPNNQCGRTRLCWVKRKGPHVQSGVAVDEARLRASITGTDNAIGDAIDKGADRVFAERAVKAGFELTGRGRCTDCQLMNTFREGNVDVGLACNAMRKRLGIPFEANCCDTDYIWVKRKT